MEPSLYSSASRTEELPLFAQARASDPDTSHEAAARITAKLSTLQQQVLTALALFGTKGANGRELEQLPVFKACAPSTVRKRLTELHRMDRVEEIGKREGLTVYRRVAVAK